jgi:dipeptidyl-peptidase-4
MKKIQWLLIAILVLSALAYAQEKMLTIDDIYDPAKRVAFSGRPTFVEWAKDGVSFRQVQNGMLMHVNALSGKSEQFFDVKKMASVLSQSAIGVTDASQIAQSPTQQFNQTENAILINHKKDLWLYDIIQGTVKRLTNSEDEELEADFSPDGKMISFVRGNNLFVVEAATAKEKQLTRDGGEKILNGYLDWVYEEELYGRGNKRGYWWSPDSTFIAFLRTDESPVKPFVIVNHEGLYQTVENEWYPKAGTPNPLVTLGVVNTVSAPSSPIGIGKIKLPESVTKRLPQRILPGVAKFVDLSKYKPEDFLIVRVAWSPDSKAVIFQAQNREQTFMDLNAAAVDGKVTTLFRETSKAWVGINGDPIWLKDGTFLWQSERDGFNHLYHYGKDGRLIKQITDGKWEISNFHGIDEKNGYAYFSAIGENNNWLDTHVYRVKFDGSGFQRLTTEAGTHRASFNSGWTHFVDNWSDLNTPVQTRLYKSDGTLERVINENKVEALAQYKLGQTEFLKVKNRDGFEMEAMRILPPDFDASKKYPVFAFTYSGPHAPQVRNQWGGSRYMWHQMLAQKGYIIWVCDNRSASGKGLESTWTVYKQFGVTEVKDLEDSFNYLKSLSYVDGERLGMWGWSYGGFMTSYFMTHSKTLKIGIAGGSVTDWQLYDSIYTERFMMTPQNNKDGYEKGSVTKAAANLHGRLLLIHGAIDDNVHLQNTMQLVFALQKAGKQFDLMLYPTARHGVTNPLQVKQMYQMMTDFVVKNL